MIKTFADVLTIKNGRDQKAVENPDGKYPIYGSGGIMGHADKYICDAETVVIGRKGNINHPIYVEVPFWNVDTAFGLEADKRFLLPRYLYYFCKKYNFEQHNKTVTIPSLTKADLLKIRIDLPDIQEQQHITDQLVNIEDVIGKRKQELNALDALIKARFVEMFGDPSTNDKELPTMAGEELFNISNGKNIPNGQRLKEGIPAYGGNGISYYTEKVLCEFDTIVIGRVGFQSGNVHLTKAPLWVTDNAMYVSRINAKRMRLDFLYEMMKIMDFKKKQDMGDLKKVTQKPFMESRYLVPPIEMQDRYIDFVHQLDKSKYA